MEQSRKNKVRELYERIDELDRRLAKAGSKSESGRIKRQITSLRKEVGELLKLEETKGLPSIYLRSAGPPQVSSQPDRSPAFSRPDRSGSSNSKRNKLSQKG
jgi:hypothetical protein